MSNFKDFQKMIKNLNDEKLSELCEEFLTNHEAAMNILFKYCSEFGLTFDSQEIKDNMTIITFATPLFCSTHIENNFCNSDIWECNECDTANPP